MIPAPPASSQSNSPMQRTSKTRVSLQSGWQFREAGGDSWHAATVPGCVHTDLLANKLIEDPFYRDNEKTLQWIGKTDWEYQTTFKVAPQTLKQEHVELVFEGLDTYAEVFFNDTSLLRADNMFRTWRVDCRRALKTGNNVLRIRFRSPINEVLPLMAKLNYQLPAPNDQGEKTSPYTRKAPYHYGWDWGPRFVTSGIWKPVFLEAWNDARLADVNSLVVKVDSTRLKAGVPTLVTDWWNYGGLTRSVMLVELPETFVQDYFIQLRRGTRNSIEGWVKLNGKNATQKVNIEVPEAKLSKSVSPDANRYAQFNFNADLTLWSPEQPKLYNVAVTTAGDTVWDQIGFRTIEVKGGDILLNGKQIFLRGVCIHEEAPLRSGRAFSIEDARLLLGWAKEMGCNFVRLAHYPHNEFMIREADRLGLMVWSEVPVYWSISWENPATLALAQSQLTENIARDHNRAAVILWSVANETPEGKARLAFLRKLIERARSLDQTRLLTAAMLNHYVGDTTKMIDDSLGEYLDVLGCNEYIGWYDGLPAKTDGIEWKTTYQKPVIMSEFGAEAVYGLHGDELTRWTEEYQESFYRHSLAMLNKITFLRGTCPWLLMDFRSPRRPLAGIQDFYNRKGLISDRGEKKEAFYVMQEFYRRLQN